MLGSCHFSFVFLRRGKNDEAAALRRAYKPSGSHVIVTCLLHLANETNRVDRHRTSGPALANAPPHRLLLYGGGLPAFHGHMTVTCLLHLANALSRDGRTHRTSSAVLSLPPPLGVPCIGDGGPHLHVCFMQYVTGCSTAAAAFHQARFPLVARCCCVGSSLAEPPLLAFIVVCRHPGARVDLLDPRTA